MNRRTHAAGMALLLSVLVAVVDQLVKWQIVRAFALNQSRALIPPILDVTYRQNPGAAFSMPLPLAVLLGITVAVLAVFTVLIRPYLTRRIGLAAGALVFGGALGNLIDRIRLQYVIDYIDVHVWPVFNLADMCVVAGVALLMLLIIRGDRAPTLTGGQSHETDTR